MPENKKLENKNAENKKSEIKIVPLNIIAKYIQHYPNDKGKQLFYLLFPIWVVLIFVVAFTFIIFEHT